MGTWGGKRFRTKAMRAQKVHISLFPLATLVAPILGQLQFNGGVSSSSNSNSNSASAETTRGGPGATPPAGATTVETCRPRRGIQTTPGPTQLAATKDDEECEECHYLKLLNCEIHHICG